MRSLTNRQKSRFQLHQDDVLELLNDEQNRAGETKKTHLYDHQIDAVLRTVNYFNSPRSRYIGLIQIPTGGGKSGIISMLPYALGSRKVMVLSPGNVITKQLKTDFGGDGSDKSFYIEKNVISSDLIDEFLPPVYAIKVSKQLPDMSKYEAVIVNAQKFSRTARPEIILNGRHGKIRADIFDKFETIIVDEAHHYPANTWKDIIEIFKDRKVIFLTATPNPDAEHLYDRVYEITPNELVTRRIIRRIDFKPLTDDINEMTDDQLTTFAKAFAIEMKEVLDQQDAVVTNVVHKAMVLVKKDKDYTKQIANKFNSVADLDLRATYCISDVQSETNLAIFNQNNNHFKVMVVCQRLTEGYDKHNVSMCVILRNIQSDILFSQFVGRCIRISHDRNNLPNDDVVAKVYTPEGMWNKYERIALADPEDDDDFNN